MGKGVSKVSKEIVSRSDLRKMRVGQAIEFCLNDPHKMESARSACNQLKIEGLKFKTKFNLNTTSILIQRLT